MSNRLQSKVIVVTGGTSGMGSAFAKRAVSEGATVLIGARDKARGEATVADITAEGGTALFVPTDVTVEEEVAHLVDVAVKEFGGLHGAFNNAGGGNSQGAIRDIDKAFWDGVIALNLTSVFYSLKHQIPAIVASGGGSIVNNASVVGVVGDPGAAAYAAAKHGVVGLTRSTALDAAKEGVRVNALVTGLVNTPCGRASPPATRKPQAPSSTSSRPGGPPTKRRSPPSPPSCSATKARSSPVRLSPSTAHSPPATRPSSATQSRSHCAFAARRPCAPPATARRRDRPRRIRNQLILTPCAPFAIAPALRDTRTCGNEKEPHHERAEDPHIRRLALADHRIRTGGRTPDRRRRRHRSVHFLVRQRDRPVADLLPATRGQGPAPGRHRGHPSAQVPLLPLRGREEHRPAGIAVHPHAKIVTDGTAFKSPRDFAKVIHDIIGAAPTAHSGYMPEITIAGPHTATGIWSMQDVMNIPAGTKGIEGHHGYGQYRETYEKVHGTWLISSVKLTRFWMEPLPAWTPPADQSAK